jgi:DNA-binding protein
MKTSINFSKITYILACLFSILLINNKLAAQNIGINATGATPDASAALDVANSTKGMLVPRVALTGVNSASPITSPATSLIIYNTATAGTAPNDVTPGYYFWN